MSQKCPWSFEVNIIPPCPQSPHARAAPSTFMGCSPGCFFTPVWVRGWDPGYSGYSVLCQCSIHFSFHPKTHDKTHTQGKAQTVLQPGTGDSATSSSRVTPPLIAFLAHHQCRNAACSGDGFAESLQGNVGFKGGHQNPKAQLSPPHCHRHDQPVPSGLHTAAGMWHRAGDQPAVCPPHCLLAPPWQHLCNAVVLAGCARPPKTCSPSGRERSP